MNGVLFFNNDSFAKTQIMTKLKVQVSRFSGTAQPKKWTFNEVINN